MRSSLRGFLTTPHNNPVAGIAVRFAAPTGPVIGNFLNPIVFRNGADAGMIALNNHIFRNIADGFNIISSTAPPLVPGQVISAISQYTGIQRNITIQSITDSGLGLNNIVRTTGRAIPGDSGGLVFSRVPNTPNQVFAIGMIFAFDDYPFGTNMRFTRADFVNRELGVNFLP